MNDSTGPTTMTTPSAIRLIPMSEVRRRLGNVGKSTYYRRVKEDGWPAPIEGIAREAVLREDDLNDLIDRIAPRQVTEGNADAKQTEVPENRQSHRVHGHMARSPKKAANQKRLRLAPSG